MGSLYEALAAQQQADSKGDMLPLIGSTLINAKPIQTGDWRYDIGGTLTQALLGGMMTGYSQASQKQELQNNMGKLAELQMQNPDAGSLYKALATSDDPAMQKLAPAQAQVYMEQQAAMQKLLREKQLGYEFEKAYAPGLEGAKEAAKKQTELNYIGAIEAAKKGAEFKSAFINPLDNPATQAVDSKRTEFAASPVYKNYVGAEVAIKRMENALKDSSGASDIPFIYGLIQTVEPTGMVREGEQALIVDRLPLATQVKQEIFSVLKGESKLGPVAKEQIFKIAVGNYKGYRDQYVGMHNEYADLLKKRGIQDVSGVSMLPKSKKASYYLGLLANALDKTPGNSPLTPSQALAGIRGQ